MSVLIKMVMPQNCRECRFMETVHRLDGRERYICIAHLNEITNLKERLDTCPLVELPDHGDLIDRDALMSHKGSAYDIDGHELYAVGTGTILRMPVIIPAERSEDG